MTDFPSHSPSTSSHHSQTYPTFTHHCSNGFQFLSLLPDDVLERILLMLPCVSREYSYLCLCSVCGRYTQPLLEFLKTVAPLLMVSVSWSCAVRKLLPRMKGAFRVDSKSLGELIASSDACVVTLPRACCVTLSLGYDNKKTIAQCVDLTFLKSVSCISVHLLQIEFDASKLQSLIQTFPHLTHVRLTGVTDDLFRLGPLFRHAVLHSFQVVSYHAPSLLRFPLVNDSIFNLSGSAQEQSLRSFEIWSTPLDLKWTHAAPLNVPDLRRHTKLKQVRLDVGRDSAFMLEALEGLTKLRRLRISSQAFDLAVIQKIKGLKFLCVDVPAFYPHEVELDFDQEHDMYSEFGRVIMNIDRTVRSGQAQAQSHGEGQDNVASAAGDIKVELEFYRKDAGVLWPVVRKCSERTGLNITITPGSGQPKFPHSDRYFAPMELGLGE